MNKSRVEAFSDGVFSIVMTLLILDVRVPEVVVTTNIELWQHLLTLWPLVATYFVTFIVLSVFWINHHFVFHSFAKAVNRQLNLLNLFYLMFIAFVPFSAHLLGNFHQFQAGVIIYGINIFIVVLFARWMTYYIRQHPELLADGLSSRIMKQGNLRGSLALFCYLLGIAVSFFSTELSIFLYAFPVVFNFIPGTLDLAEKIFKFSLD